MYALMQYSRFLFTSFMAANKAILYIEFLARNDARDESLALLLVSGFVSVAFHVSLFLRVLENNVIENV